MKHNFTLLLKVTGGQMNCYFKFNIPFLKAALIPQYAEENHDTFENFFGQL